MNSPNSQVAARGESIIWKGFIVIDYGWKDRNRLGLVITLTQGIQDFEPFVCTAHAPSHSEQLLRDMRSDLG
jgi:hypothetical protein